ncbi:hypothetical protein [Agromyces sp. M3QZ16-3]|uniref:hypothetical protein n=1 Tax=Agromyces sp. M3QZ16-3 TaxID=3447585 RepID=UPI003F68E10E
MSSTVPSGRSRLRSHGRSAAIAARGRNTIATTTETRAPRPIRDAFHRTPPWLLAAIAAAVVIAMAVVVTQPWMVPTDLVRDAQVVAAARGAASPAYGLVSNLGIVGMLLAAGAACAALALRPRRQDVRRLLAWSLTLTLVVASDDLLLLHETAAFGPGSGLVLAAAYAVAFVAFAARFRELIVQRFDPALLAAMFAGLGTSAVVDVLVDPATRASVLVEDGAKLLGLLAWSAFVARAAFLTLRADRRSAGDR